MKNILTAVVGLAAVVLYSIVSLVYGDVEWTRLAGKVKAINLKTNTVTIQNRDGDLISVPVDWQVKVIDKHGEQKQSLKQVDLDEKVILLRTPQEKPVEDTSGMAQPEPYNHGK